MQQDGFIEALRDSSKENPLKFQSGQELDLTLPGNLHLLLVSKSEKPLLMWREKHHDRNSASIIIDSDDVHFDIEQMKLTELEISHPMYSEDVSSWVKANITKEQFACVVPAVTKDGRFSVVFWG